MSPTDNDSSGHAPIKPAHDEIASYQRSTARGKLASSLGAVPEVSNPPGSGAPKGLLILFLVVAMLTAAFSGYLFFQLQSAQQTIQNYELRITDLERQLSVTDESMSESAVAMKVKLRELDSEIRKLWDNVWKKSKQRLAAHETTLAEHEKKIAAADNFITSATQQFSESRQMVQGMKNQLEKAERVQSLVSTNQLVISQQEQALESTADKVNRSASDIVKLRRRIKETEEWIESINSFRKQVNRDLNAIKQSPPSQ